MDNIRHKKAIDSDLIFCNLKTQMKRFTTVSCFLGSRLNTELTIKTWHNNHGMFAYVGQTEFPLGIHVEWYIVHLNGNSQKAFRYIKHYKLNKIYITHTLFSAAKMQQFHVKRT